MRGAPDAPFAVAGSAGIIPAYAGSTRPTSTARCSPRDHPRVCGEHIKNQRDAGEGEGSSPRMRGALGENRRIRSTHGFIPAYAGSTRLAARFHRTNGVHPRVCGEHGQDAQEAGGGRGSSPRMRGALALREDPVLQRGFIPAYAGSTCSRRHTSCRCKVHPRVCGEHILLVIPALTWVGSSPRMRGALSFCLSSLCSFGFIPAYAGSTCGVPGRACRCQVHPRVCGEHRSVLAPKRWYVGSSPRMRGALLGGVEGIPRRGFIPAYAGSTRTSPAGSRTRRVHPRVCGEHDAGRNIMDFSKGSSPRMRGAH